MTKSLFTSDGYWIIGAETPACIRQDSFPPNSDEFIDAVTARKYWPYLPHVDLEYMERHNPGSKQLLEDLKLALHEEWDMHEGWTGMCESGRALRIVEQVTAEVEDKELAAFCSGIIEDLLSWARHNESFAVEGREVLKEYAVQSPEVLLTFPYDPAGLFDAELDSWHGELRRSYLHHLIRNAVEAPKYEERLKAWEIKGYTAVREWLEIG